MSDRYLLTCECGRQLLIDPAQAGRRLTCVCGAKVEAPTLRQLRKLPVAPADFVAQTPSWTWEKAAMFVGVLLLAASVVFGAALYVNGPLKPREQIAEMEKRHAEQLQTELKTARPQEVIAMFQSLAQADLSRYAASLESGSVYDEYNARMKTHESWAVFGWCLAGLALAVIALCNILPSARAAKASAEKAKAAKALHAKVRAK